MLQNYTKFSYIAKKNLVQIEVCEKYIENLGIVT